MGRIVVGVDGSEESVRGLRWARDEARLRDCALELVHTYPELELSYPQPDLVDSPDRGGLPTEAELARAKTELLRDALTGVGGADEVEVTITVRTGSAAATLCEAAAGADLLVVGARGLGGFRGLLLGSVSQQVVAHSPCPVVIVTPETGRG